MDSNRFKRTLILFAIALLIFLFGLNSRAVELIYSDGFYPIIAIVLRALSCLFPFALGDFLYLALVVYSLCSVFIFLNSLRKGRFSTIQPTDRAYKSQQKVDLIIKPVNFILLLYITFKVLWGLNYSRPSVTTRLGISNQKYNTKELVSLGDFLISRVNSLQQQMDMTHTKHAFTIPELKQHAKLSYDKLALKNSFFTYRIASVKPVLNSWLISKIGIEGYYCPPSGEANVNARIPAAALPFVTCHEISHQLGIAREDEANLIGYLVSINSDDLNFQYAGYYDILRSVLFEIRIKSPDDFIALRKKINNDTLLDFKKEQDFWTRYNGDMSAYMGTALDSFLKINNQQKGTDSYQDIVLWVYNLHRNQLVPGGKNIQMHKLITTIP
jgi:hypothetical protein